MPRPVSVTVFGVLNIVFGVLGLLTSAVTVGILFAAAEPGGGIRLQENSVLNAWLLLATGLGIVFTIVLIAAGIGLMRLRPWGRTASLAYAGYAILSGIIGMVLSWTYMVKPLLEQPQAGRDGAEVGGAVGGMIGGCIGFIYPLLLWYFMTRPNVVAAFAGISLSEPSEFAPTIDLEGNVARDPHNPYVSPATQSVPLGATPGTGDSIVEAFVPSKNAPALWSYYLGLFSLFPCLGFFLAIPAVVMGLRGLRLERAHPEVRGGVHAWVGLICGVLFGTFNLLLLIFSVVGMVAAFLQRRA